MKKLLLIFISILAVSALAACGNKLDEETADQYITQAKEVVQLLNEENYEKVKEQFDAKMKAEFKEEHKEGLRSIIADAGQFKAFEKQSVEEKDSLYTVVLVAKYSKVDHVYTIFINENNEIAGLYIK